VCIADYNGRRAGPIFYFVGGGTSTAEAFPLVHALYRNNCTNFTDVTEAAEFPNRLVLAALGYYDNDVGLICMSTRMVRIFSIMTWNGTFTVCLPTRRT